MINRHRLRLLGLATMLAGCAPTIHQDFEYEPNKIVTVQRSNLKIAVVPFVDKRETFEKGSQRWAWVPLVPAGTESRDRRQDPSERTGNDYYFPDLAAYTIALDLASSGVGGRVDIAPPALEDYDLIVHGTLNSTAQSDRTLSYGLGPLSAATVWFGLPQGSRAVRFDGTYVVYDANGRTLLERAISKEWSKFNWGAKDPFMHGVVTTVREANREFIEALVPLLQAPPLSPEAEATAQRIRQYHARLDPELPRLIAERNRTRARGDDASRGYAGAVDAEVHRRARYLETWRRVEDRIIAKQQDYVYETQQLRLAQIAQARAAKREAAAQQQRMKQAERDAVLRPLAGAFVAGTMPAVASAQSQGQWAAPQWRQLTQDLSVALAAMPPPPPPPRNLESLVREIDTEGATASAGAVLSGVQGNNIPELRDSFMGKYRTLVHSLAEIQQTFAARQPE